MKILLLIPSVMKTEMEETVLADRHPMMDYWALVEALQAMPDSHVDFLDYASVDRARHLLVRLARRMFGRDPALALLGFLERRSCDAIFANGENVAIPLALLFKCLCKRPNHVAIGHRLSAVKKRFFFRNLHVHKQIDTIFVYSQTQRNYAMSMLGIPPEKLSLISFHADQRFYRSMPEVPVDPSQICSAGLEWRDYPTLIAAVADLPELSVRLAASSPWSKYTDETASRVLPPHVDARRYEYSALRDLYASSNFVIVPLYENDFQAGVTTLLEAMAMGKAVIITRTLGQIDVITDGENGLMVAPGDPAELRQAILRLRTDDLLRERLGRNAALWVKENATLPQWVNHMVDALYMSSSALHQSTDAAAQSPVTYAHEPTSK